MQTIRLTNGIYAGVEFDAENHSWYAEIFDKQGHDIDMTSPCRTKTEAVESARAIARYHRKK